MGSRQLSEFGARPASKKAILESLHPLSEPAPQLESPQGVVHLRQSVNDVETFGGSAFDAGFGAVFCGED